MTKKHTPYILLIGLMALATSCKTHNSVVRADDYDSETIVDLMNEESPTISGKHQGVRPSKDNNKPHLKATTPIDGEWTIIEAGDKKIKQESDMPYLIFSESEGRFYASNGCNILNGDYTYDKDTGIIGFANVLSTMAYCPDITYQQDISVVLNDGVTVKTKIERKGNESYLYLTSNSNDKLMTLRRHNLEAINGQWDVEEIGGTKFSGNGMNVFFDIAQASIHGNTGCNYFNGKIDIDPFTASAIAFTEMGVTMKACPNSDSERKMLVALEEVTTYNLKDHNTLLLKDSSGKTVITLKRNSSI